MPWRLSNGNGRYFLGTSLSLQYKSLLLTFDQGKKPPKSADISQRHELNTQDFRSIYFNLFLVILPKFGSLYFYTTYNLIQTLLGTPLLGLPVV